MELILAGESRPDTTDLNIKIMIKKKNCQVVCVVSLGKCLGSKGPAGRHRFKGTLEARTGFSVPWSAQLFSGMVRREPATCTAKPGGAPFADTLNRYGGNTLPGSHCTQQRALGKGSSRS